MTRYAEDIDCARRCSASRSRRSTLAEVLAGAGLRQLHAAETEKYAHVTYFFNGGVEEPWPGEDRILVPSPRDVPSYDKKPACRPRSSPTASAAEIGDGYSFAVINFANPDMVGHTGVIPAVVEAVETTDRCLGRVVDRVAELSGACLIIADHGNAEKLLQADGVSPHTAHTTNPVPLIFTAEGELRDGGELSDLAPTILHLLGLEESAEMSGKDLLKPSAD